MVGERSGGRRREGRARGREREGRRDRGTEGGRLQLGRADGGSSQRRAMGTLTAQRPCVVHADQRRNGRGCMCVATNARVVVLWEGEGRQGKQ